MLREDARVDVPARLKCFHVIALGADSRLFEGDANVGGMLGLSDLVSQRSGSESFGSDARNFSSACADVLLGGACKVMMYWPGDWVRASCVRVRYRSPTSGWRMWLIPLGYPTSACSQSCLNRLLALDSSLMSARSRGSSG